MEVVVHYGTPTVWVEPYRVRDRWGDEFEIEAFTRDEGNGEITGTGHKIKKDGTPGGARRSGLRVPVSDAVRTAMATLPRRT